MGSINNDVFAEMCYVFPDVYLNIKQNMKQYQDRYKVWQKFQLKKIPYFTDLSFETLEELSYCLQSEYFQSGQIIFKKDSICEKLYVLVSGEVEIYQSLNSEDLILDTLVATGSIIAIQSVLCKGKMTF